MEGINTAAFEHFPVLETPRLILRCITTADVDAIYAMRSNDRIREFIFRENMAEKSQAIPLIEKVLHGYQNKQLIGWAGEDKKTGKFIGSCGFIRLNFENRSAEIGGEMLLDYWGKQFAIEAVQAIITYGFKTFGLHRIEAFMAPNNRPAIYLLESLGFSKEAHLRDYVHFKQQYHDMSIYAALNPYHTHGTK
jgi:ribosomal-protein-alanine N-acetyltransferase